MSRLRRLLGTHSVAWGAVDQGLSSGTNFLLMLVTVRSVDVEQFGAFSLVYLLYMLVLPVARSTGTMPYTISQAHVPPAQAVRAAAASVHYAFTLGVVAGAGSLILAFLGPRTTASSFTVLACFFPLLLVQDAVRGILFFRSKYISATVNDTVWAVVMFLALAPALTLGWESSVAFFAAWGLGGCAAGIYGLLQLRVNIRLVSPVAWWRLHGDLAGPLFLNMAFAMLPAQLTYLLMPLVSSVTELGAIRAAYVLFGFLSVVYLTTSMISLPYASRLQPQRMRRFTLRLSSALALIAIGWGLLLMLIPASIGREIIGPAWDTTTTVRALLAISLVAEGFTVGPSTALAALQLPDRITRVRFVTAPLTLISGLALAGLWGAEGVALAFALGYTATAAWAWLQMPPSAEPPRVWWRV